MKKFILSMTALLSILLFTPANATNTSGILLITVTNIKTPTGVIRLALYNSADSYNTSNSSGSNAYQTAVGVIIIGGESIINLHNIPYGEYAIKLYQDVNNSGKFQTGWFGIPKEGYGFSKNPSANDGAPKYDLVKFIFDAKHTTQNITLQYYH